MDYDILKSVSQGSDGAQDAENSRIAAIADELRRLCQLHEAQPGTGQPHVSPFEIEQRITESFAKEHGLRSPSSTQSAALKLLEYDLITRKEKIYSLSDPLMDLWLDRR